MILIYSNRNFVIKQHLLKNLCIYVKKDRQHVELDVKYNQGGMLYEKNYKKYS